MLIFDVILLGCAHYYKGCVSRYVQYVSGESGHTKNYAFIGKSIIFKQSLGNCVKIRASWVPYFDKYS